MKLNYIIIPAIALLTASLGSYITEQGISWYYSLSLPAWTPPGYFIGAVWTVLYILTTIAALLVWNRFERNQRFWLTIYVFAANAALNFLWSYLFFKERMLTVAVYEAGLLGLSVLVLIMLIWPRSKAVAILLLPYLLWVSFATYLAYTVSVLN